METFVAVQTDPIVEPENVPRNPEDQLPNQDMDNDDAETEEGYWLDDDPTWSPEQTDLEYKKIKDEDDSEKTKEKQGNHVNSSVRMPGHKKGLMQF